MLRKRGDLSEAKYERDLSVRQRAESFFDGLFDYVASNYDKENNGWIRTKRGSFGFMAHEFWGDSFAPSLVVSLEPSGPGRIKAGLGKSGKYDVIVLNVLKGPHDVTYLPSRLSGMRSAAVHEIIHLIDPGRLNSGRTSADAFQSSGDSAYYNHPSEWNAFWQDGAATVERFANNEVMKNPELRGTFKRNVFGDGSLKGFQEKESMFWDNGFLKGMNQTTRRKFDKRLAQLWKELKDRGVLEDVMWLSGFSFGLSESTGMQVKVGLNHWVDVVSDNTQNALSEIRGTFQLDKSLASALDAKGESVSNSEQKMLAHVEKAGPIDLGYVSKRLLYAKFFRYMKKQDHAAILKLLKKGKLKVVQISDSGDEYGLGDGLASGKVSSGIREVLVTGSQLRTGSSENREDVMMNTRRVIGEAEMTAQEATSSRTKQIYDVLSKSKKPMTAKQIAAALGVISYYGIADIEVLLSGLARGLFRDKGMAVDSKSTKDGMVFFVEEASGLSGDVLGEENGSTEFKGKKGVWRRVANLNIFFPEDGSDPMGIPKPKDKGQARKEVEKAKKKVQFFNTLHSKLRKEDVDQITEGEEPVQRKDNVKPGDSVRLVKGISATEKDLIKKGNVDFKFLRWDKTHGYAVVTNEAGSWMVHPEALEIMVREDVNDVSEAWKDRYGTKPSSYEKKPFANTIQNIIVDAGEMKADDAKKALSVYGAVRVHPFSGTGRMWFYLDSEPEGIKKLRADKRFKIRETNEDVDQISEMKNWLIESQKMRPFKSDEVQYPGDFASQFSSRAGEFFNRPVVAYYVDQIKGKPERVEVVRFRGSSDYVNTRVDYAELADKRVISSLFLFSKKPQLIAIKDQYGVTKQWVSGSEKALAAVRVDEHVDDVRGCCFGKPLEENWSFEIFNGDETVQHGEEPKLKRIYDLWQASKKKWNTTLHVYKTGTSFGVSVFRPGTEISEKDFEAAVMKRKFEDVRELRNTLVSG